MASRNSFPDSWPLLDRLVERNAVWRRWESCSSISGSGPPSCRSVSSATGVGELAVRRRGVAFQGRAFDVHVRQPAVQPTGQIPGAATQQCHDRRDERHPDDEGVDEDAEGEGEPDALDGGVRAEDESREHRRHDQGCGRHDPRAVTEAADDGLTRLGAVHVLAAGGAGMSAIVRLLLDPYDGEVELLQVLASLG